MEGRTHGGNGLVDGGARLLRGLADRMQKQLGGRRAELESELADAKRLASEVEARAQELQLTLEEELKQERSVRELLSRQLLAAQDGYGSLSDALESEQMKSSSQLKEWTAKLEQVQTEAQKVQHSKKQLEDRLREVEASEQQLKEQNETLKKELRVAQGREASLGLLLAQQAAALAEAQELLKASEAEKEQLQASNNLLQQRLELTEKALAALLTEAPAGIETDLKQQAVSPRPPPVPAEQIPSAGKHKGSGKGRGKPKHKGRNGLRISDAAS